MNKELQQQLDYDDALVMLNSMCQQYGAREFLSDFRHNFPDMFEEILVQINRFGPPRKTAALLR